MRRVGVIALELAACAALSCSDSTGVTPSGPPASLLLVGGQGQAGVVGQELAEPLRVKVLDAEGRPVRGQVVNFRVTSGGGTVFAGVALTTDSGTAADRWTLGTVAGEAQRVEARAVDPNTGQPLVFATFEATAAPAAPASVVAAGGGQQQGAAGAPLPDLLAVEVRDQYGNAVPDIAVAWVVHAGGGALSAPTTTTNSAGVARVQWTLGDVAGDAQVVRAAVGAVATLTFEATAQPARYVLTLGGVAQVVSSVTISAQLSDQNDNPIRRAGKTVTWLAPGANGSLSPQTSTTNADGIATTTYTAGTVAGAVNISATDEHSYTGAQLFQILPGPAAQLAFITPPSNVGWRIVMKPAVSVAVRDQYGNTIDSDTRQIGLELVSNPAGATLEGGAPVESSNGIASFPAVMLDQPGTGYTLRATSSGLTSVQSAAFDVSTIAIVTTLDHTTPAGIAVTGDKVYLTSGAQVWSAPITGGGRSSVLGPPCDNLFNRGGGRILAGGTQGAMAVSCGHIASAAAAQAVRFPLTGGNVGLTSLGGGWAQDLVFDGTYYFASYGMTDDVGSTGIVRIRASDGAALGLRAVNAAAFSPPPSIAVAGGYVYYTGATDIERIPIGGGTSNVVSSGHNLSGTSWGRMVVANERVYWISAGGIVSAPVSGGTTTPHVAISSTARSMVTDGEFLYVNDGGSLRRYRLADFSVTTIAPDDGVVDIALDATAVYWTSSSPTPTVKKAPK